MSTPAEEAVFAILKLCNSVEYKVPGRPETYSQYAEGRLDFASEVENAIADNFPQYVDIPAL